MELRKSPEVPPLLLIRERCEGEIAAKDKVQVAVQAMREEELHAYILNWRTTEEQAVEAYDKLRQLLPEKYPSVEYLKSIC